MFIPKWGDGEFSYFPAITVYIYASMYFAQQMVVWVVAMTLVLAVVEVKGVYI